MCQSHAEGGRRCAAHTRVAYTQAIGDVLGATTPGQVYRAREFAREAVIAHAMTPTGHTEVEADIAKVRANRHAYQDATNTAMWLTQCLYEADEENARATRTPTDDGIDLIAAYEKATGTRFTPYVDRRSPARIEADEERVDRYVAQLDSFA